jgi:diguanylate cyclase (GGDEF)-like protein/PAS domain S-box-containing protein
MSSATTDHDASGALAAGLSIAVVEDSPADALLTRELLRAQRPQPLVSTYGRVEEAEAGLAKGGADCILLDLGLPGLEGLEALDRIIGVAPDAPIVVLTGLDDDELALAAVRRGAQDYVTKRGLDAATLWRTINRAIERQRLVAASVLNPGERELAASARAQLVELVESSDDAVIGLTLDGKVVSWSRGAERMYGYAAREMLGQHISLLSPPGCADELAEHRARLEGGARVDGYETARHGRGGREIDVSLMISPVLDGDGRVVGASEIARDISQRKQAEAGFLTLLDSAPDAIVIVSAQGRVVQANSQAEAMFGYTLDELRTLGIEDLLPERYRRLHERHRTRFLASPHRRLMGTGLELYALLKDGRELPVEISLGPLRTEEGPVVAAAIRDISDRKRDESALREAEETFRRAFAEAPIGMAMLDLDARFAQVNEALCGITGYARVELESTSLAAITHPDDLADEDRGFAAVRAGEVPGYRADTRLLHAGQRPVWVALQATLLRDSDGRPLRFLAQIQDITDRQRYEERLRHLADHDALTGLANRRSFERELKAHAALSERYGGGGVVIVLDLDHFKLINDTLGHAAGDDALGRAAHVLRSRLRESDVVARLGGDEFAILLPHADASEAMLVTHELLSSLRAQAIDLEGDVRSLAASAGIALFETGRGLSGEDVLMNADLAMYEAKDAGRDRAKLYREPEPESPRVIGRSTWAQRIAKALKEDAFTLLAQPVVDLATGAERQHEVLLRMTDERDDLIPPGSFLYIAERLGMAQEIDRWVARQAIAAVARARSHGRELTLEVNLSGHSIGDRDLLALVAAECARAAVVPASLIFEVTEAAASINMTRASRFARELVRLGCRFALDDFGAGFGSIHNLKHIPFDFLKIDGGFIDGCRTSSADRLLVKASADIATGLGKQTIAECVGDEETVAILRDLGVDYGQGYHVGHPVPLTSLLT